jgi:hypothetical protein
VRSCVRNRGSSSEIVIPSLPGGGGGGVQGKLVGRMHEALNFKGHVEALISGVAVEVLFGQAVLVSAQPSLSHMLRTMPRGSPWCCRGHTGSCCTIPSCVPECPVHFPGNVKPLKTYTAQVFPWCGRCGL